MQKKLPNISHEVAGKDIWWKGYQMLNDSIQFLTAGKHFDRHSFAFRVRNNGVLFWTQQKRSSLFHKFTSWGKKQIWTNMFPCFNTSAQSKNRICPPNKTSFFQGEKCRGFQAKFYESLEPKSQVFWLEKTLFWKGPRLKIEDHVARGDLTHPCQVAIAPAQPPVMWREVMAVFGSFCFVSWLPCVFF